MRPGFSLFWPLASPAFFLFTLIPYSLFSQHPANCSATSGDVNLPCGACQRRCFRPLHPSSLSPRLTTTALSPPTLPPQPACLLPLPPHPASSGAGAAPAQGVLTCLSSFVQDMSGSSVLPFPSSLAGRLHTEPSGILLLPPGSSTFGYHKAGCYEPPASWCECLGYVGMRARLWHPS